MEALHLRVKIVVLGMYKAIVFITTRKPRDKALIDSKRGIIPKM
jgi:hypothetical protein